MAWSTTGPITHIYTANGADVMAVYRTMQARLAFAKGERWAPTIKSRTCVHR